MVLGKAESLITFRMSNVWMEQYNGLDQEEATSLSVNLSIFYPGWRNDVSREAGSCGGFTWKPLDCTFVSFYLQNHSRNVAVVNSEENGTWNIENEKSMTAKWLRTRWMGPTRRTFRTISPGRPFELNEILQCILTLCPGLLYFSRLEVLEFPNMFVFRDRRGFVGSLEVRLHKILPDSRISFSSSFWRINWSLIKGASLSFVHWRT